MLRVVPVTTALGLALVAGLAGCSDDRDGGGVSARTACGSRVRWEDGTVESVRFARDDRGRLTEAETRDGMGAVVRYQTWTWDGKLLRATEAADAGDGRVHTEYDYEFDRLLRVTRTDDRGAVIVTTYGYAGDAMVTQDIEARGAGQHRHATITGDGSERTTIVDCAVTGPSSCQTWRFEQPDRVAEHWTRATVDLTSDGAIDVVYERALDGRGGELTFTETALDDRGTGTLLARETTTRDPDGAELGYTRETWSGGAARTARVDAELTCASPKPGRLDGPDAAVATGHALPARLALDETSLAPRLLRRPLE